MRDLHQLSQRNGVENGASCLANTIRRTNTLHSFHLHSGDVVEEPEFTDVIQNVTVPAGRSVRLACSVKNLGSYKTPPGAGKATIVVDKRKHKISSILSFDLERAVVIKCPYKERKR
ncbi:unnamed protein product [Danaus chrysippus]|uniref:(African queen) hypothetical protein n=1 Tax=Danaus chrysippus TaxID=151541 RepID=A0A8J2R4W8_9NEOP|nr:unnamed protein product [Danaus chrysippus]